MGVVRRWLFRLLSLLAWLLIWLLLSRRIGQQIILPSPGSVLARLAALVATPSFWSSILFSFGRIVSGFLLGLTAGGLLAAAGARFLAVREFFSPAMTLIKASPVASFTILLLTWVPSRNLSVVIAFLMVLPIVYTNLLTGISQTPALLLEMADLFEIGWAGRLRCIYLSELLPYLRSACALSLGLCWKAGIAAEVIGIPAGSIGERLYDSKIYFDIPELFAWTAVIVLISLVFGRLFLALLDAAVHAVERM